MDRKQLRSMVVRIAAAIGVAVALSGCIVVPAGPGYWRHPYRTYYY